VPSITPLRGDAIESYLSVHAALKKLEWAAVLGHVANGVKTDGEEEEGDFEEEEDDEEEEVGQLEKNASASNVTEKRKQGKKKWSEELGESLNSIRNCTVFACGASTSTEFSYGNKVEDYKSLHRLLISDMASNKVVLGLNLNELLDPTKLLPYCVPAAFGDLKSQTTVLDPTVRTAMEMVASNHRDASVAKHTVKFVACYSGKERVKTNCHCHIGMYSRCNCPPVYSEFSNREVTEEAPVLYGIYSSIREKMILSDFSIMPYKLNVYGPGGFFKPCGYSEC
jgi:hypothetical protein